MVTDEMVDIACAAYDADRSMTHHGGMRTALEAVERAFPPNDKPGDASRSVTLKSLRQWMKEMRRQTVLRGER